VTNIFLENFAINQDIVQINLTKVIKIFEKHVVHVVLIARQFVN